MACNLDHSHEDVVQKFEGQRAFLPQEIAAGLASFLQREHTQEVLNELFHLLKKYDLSSAEERQKRDQGMLQLMQ
ncbi:group-specific protein [Ectobacillus ponti]|uniref:Group-specific protein n=1 Tax=Ectobacillus ponti TaxID=2961894 RepID=A0AA41X663_9BACI|nr:group-specific protein [Ectobacillus ponti]MCP8969512.1 group-specific protein [Ectobacillus ponti]